MSNIKKIWREYIWQDLKEDRDDYYVIYHPINLKNCNFAQLDIIFIASVSVNELALIMEKEFDIWISRFPLPLMVTTFDRKGDKISLDSIKPNSELIGYVEKSTNKIIKTWERMPDSIFPRIEDDIIMVYKGLSYKTVEQKEQECDNYIKEKRNYKCFINITLISWIIITIVIAFLGWKNYWVGMAAFLYSFYKAIRQVFKIIGFRTKKDSEKDEKDRKMKHYYYHCELNPEGFRKLVSENVGKELEEEIKKEKRSLEKLEVKE